MSKHSFRTSFLFAGVAAFALTACSSTPMPSERADSSEQILDAEGQYELVEQSDDSPLAKHQQTKVKVHPDNLAESKTYTEDARLAKVDEATRTRILKMERELDLVKSEFKGLKSAVNEPALAMAAPPPAVETDTTGVETMASIEPVAGAASQPMDTAAYPTTSSIQAVRTGEYADKTRLVLDIDEAADFKYEIDNARSLLILRLPQSGWSAPESKVFDGSKVLKAYVAKPAQGGGTLVAVKLNAPVKVLNSEKLGANDSGMHRIFLDIAPL